MVGSLLPLGVALVAVATPLGIVELVSDRLSNAEAAVAHFIAVYELRHGHKSFLLKERELADLIDEAAA